MKKKTNKTANIIMAVAIVIIVAAGVFFVGRSNGWFNKEEKTISVTTAAAENNTEDANTSADESQAQADSEKTTNDSAQNSAETQANSSQDENVLTCTISISCETILDNMDNLNEAKKSLVPADGQILNETVEFTEGETAFDVVQRACEKNNIAIEYSWSAMYGSSYVEGINNIYEFDCGTQSGWMYKVNGNFPNYGSSSYKLTDGDTVEWVYTCTGLGEDVGA